MRAQNVSFLGWAGKNDAVNKIRMAACNISVIEQFAFTSDEELPSPRKPKDEQDYGLKDIATKHKFLIGVYEWQKN